MHPRGRARRFGYVYQTSYQTLICSMKSADSMTNACIWTDSPKADPGVRSSAKRDEPLRLVTTTACSVLGIACGYRNKGGCFFAQKEFGQDYAYPILRLVKTTCIYSVYTAFLQEVQQIYDHIQCVRFWPSPSIMLRDQDS